MSYPPDWINYGSYYDEFIDTIATFQAENDTLGRPALLILSKSTNLDGEVAKTAKDYAYTFFTDQEKFIDGYKVIELETEGITMDGRPAYRQVASYNICVEDCGDEEKRGKMLEVGIMNDDGRIIAINYDVYESDYDKYLSIAQKMIDSLELK